MSGDAKCLNRREFLINVGSRNSQLAMIQTETVIDRLNCYYDENKDTLKKEIHNHFKDGVSFRIIGMTTAGDRILDKALPDIGAKSLFTKDLEEALLEGKVDFIVHSLKDLPTTLPQGCVIGAILERDDPNDAIVLKQSLRGRVDPMDIIFDKKLQSRSTKEYIIGTSSHRRMALLRKYNQKLVCNNIRGNLNTRLKKLDQEDGQYDAIVLAKAGLDRMGWTDRASCLLTPSVDERLGAWCYAVGQGAIAVECRENDRKIIDLLAPICHLKTIYETIVERSLMKQLEGGCSIPLGVRSTWLQQSLEIKAIVLSLDGGKIVEACEDIDLDETTKPHTEQHLPISITGAIISDKMPNSDLVRARMLACSKAGISLANKMIDLGCLEVMRGTG